MRPPDSRSQVPLRAFGCFVVRITGGGVFTIQRPSGIYLSVTGLTGMLGVYGLTYISTAIRAVHIIGRLTGEGRESREALSTGLA